MSLDDAIRAFSGMSNGQQTLLLARFAHELTILMRETYLPDSAEIGSGSIARDINEVQHRVTAAIRDRIASDAKRYPDDVLVKLCCASRIDDPMENSIGRAFVRVLSGLRN